MQGETDFEDITYIENIINGLDLFFRVLPKSKMQILCETGHIQKPILNLNIFQKKQ